MLRFGADFWSAGKPRDNSTINNGGYYDREQADNPQQHDRFGQPIDTPDDTTNWAMEFPYGS